MTPITDALKDVEPAAYQNKHDGELGHFDEAPSDQWKELFDAEGIAAAEALVRAGAVPVHGEDACVLECFIQCMRAGNYPVKRKGAGFESSWTQQMYQAVYGTVSRLRLFAAPAAQPAIPPKPWPAEGNPGKWFPVTIVGDYPMREFAPGKWEHAYWPSEQPASVDAELLAMLKRWYSVVDSCVEMTPELCVQTKALLKRAESKPATRAEPSRMLLDSFIEEAKRTGVTIETLAAALAKRPEFADCLPQHGTSESGPLTDIHGMVAGDVAEDVSKPCRQELINTGGFYPKSSCQRCGSILRPGWKCSKEITEKARDAE